MDIQSEINRIKTNIADTYSAMEEQGATMPATLNSDNLAATAATIAERATAGHGIYYGTCPTAAATAGKAVTLLDATGFSLATGAVIIVRFTNANSASNPTLNVNSTGAKPIMRYGRTAVSTGTTTTGWIAGAVQVFVYDGANWVREYWNNTTYSNASLGQGYATCSTAEATTAKAGTLSSYSLTTGGIVAVKFTYSVPAGATLNINTKGAKAIYYKGAAITAGVIKAGDLATFIYNGTYYHLLAIDRNANITPESIGAAPSEHTHDYLPLSGGTMNQKATIKWTAMNGKNPYVGYCSASTDGTFMVGSIAGTNYTTGLAIGGSSGNLLWKGTKILTANDTAAKATADGNGKNIASTYATKAELTAAIGAAIEGSY